MVRRTEEEPSINLTPMIDVVFLLLIFFLAGSTFQRSNSSIPIDVSGAGQLSPVVRGVDPRIVEVASNGQIRLDGKPASLADMSKELARSAQAYPDLQVVVRADGEGVVRQFGEVVRSVRVAGVHHINFDLR